MIKSDAKYMRILSIDGGGVRGIIPGQILVNLEQKLQAKTGNPNARIADYFDLIAGTSTGGILGCGYLYPDGNTPARPKYSAQKVVDLYLENGTKIFSIPFWYKVKTLNGLLDAKYPVDNLEKVFKEYFAETKLSELLKPCLVSSYDITRRQVHLFTQHDAVQKPAWDFTLCSVCRSASAAPTYFKCAQVKSLVGDTYNLIDGGVYVNNPALSAYSEAYHEDKTTTKDMVLVSLGTGFARKSYPYEKAKSWGMAEWVKPLIDIMMAGGSDVVDYELQQIFSAMDVSKQYLRINTELTPDINPDMADGSKANLEALRKLGTETAQKFNAELDALVDMLIE